MTYSPGLTSIFETAVDDDDALLDMTDGQSPTEYDLETGAEDPVLISVCSRSMTLFMVNIVDEASLGHLNVEV